MFNALQLVVDVQLRRHVNETEEVDEPDESGNSEGVPSFVLFINQRVGGVSHQQREERVVEILSSLLIMFLRLFHIGRLKINFEERELLISSRFALSRFEDLPESNEDLNRGRRENHPARFRTVEEVEEDDQFKREARIETAQTQTLICL